MKIAVVLNARSGRGTGAKAWPRAKALLLQGGRDIHVEETTASGSAREQAARLAEQSYDKVVAAGGDGTVSQVMQGVLGSKAALAILPFGTGNDFARAIGIGTSLEKAVGAILDGQVKRVDVGSWEHDSGSGHFLNVSGCGFDAVVAERINTGVRRLKGQAAYLMAILQTLRTYKPTELSMVIDGEPLTAKTMLCSIANAQSYGGGIRVAPTALIDDGLLDLVLVGDFKPLEFLRAFPKVLKGTHLAHPKVMHRTFQTLEIESSGTAPFLIDGEMLPPGRLLVKVVPAALDVIMPR